MTMNFDLLREPWIVCETLRGKREVLGIRDVLARAHELAAVSDESPLVTAATYRLLLAIVDQAYRLSSRGEWLELWNAAQLPVAALNAYFERWGDRFDLFGEQRPFLQVARLDQLLKAAKGKDPERVTAWRFVMEMSTYSSHVHLLEPEPQGEGAMLSAAAAARALISFMAFAAGGRIQNEADSWSGGAVRGGAVILVRGRTLRETLVLNTTARSRREAEDVPPWQRERDIGRLLRPASGPVDLLVWPSRRVQLFAQVVGGEVRVTSALSAAGERIEGETPDPLMAYYVRDPKKPPMALRFDPERAVWRDANALFDSATGRDAFRRPAAVELLHALTQDRVLPKTTSLRCDVLGLSSNQAAIRFTRAESLPFPAAILADKERLAVLKEGLALADGVGVGIDRRVLFVLCERALAPGERSADKNDVAHLKDSLAVMPSFWAALGEAFQRWLLEVGECADPEDALASWRRIVKHTARSAFDTACRRLGLDARSLQAIVQAQNTLHRVLAEFLPEPSAGDSVVSSQGGEASP